jgi:YVTN family beta-propeller protein
VDSDNTDEARTAAEVRAFLIADVRGYSAYTSEHGDEAGAALAARFAELTRASVAELGGRVVELRGDEALCVFTSARQALRAAVAIQRLFRGGDFPLGIGIGLDAGEVVPVEGGYRGGALNRAARLCGLARPGRILASHTIVALAGSIEGARFERRRAVRVKGMAEPLQHAEVVPEPTLPPLPVPPRGPPGRRRRTPAVVAAIATAAVLAAALILLLGGGEAGGLERIDPGALGVIEPDDGTIAAQTLLGIEPEGLAAGGDSVWVTDAAAGTLTRVDYRRASIQTLSVGARPAGVAVGEGSVWVANSAERTVSQVNPDTRRVVRTIPVGNGPQGVAVSRGAVWVANAIDGTLSRIDPATGRVTATVPVGTDPTGIAADGRWVWLASESTARVVRVDARTATVADSIAVGNRPVAIALGEGGAWVVNAQDGTVSRIDPGRGAVTDTVRVGGTPGGATAGAGGVWIADAERGTVSRIDPDQGEVEDVIEIGNSPAALTMASGKVWTAATHAPAGHRGGTLRAAVTEELCDCFDPGFVLDPTTWRVLSAAYDGLVAYRRAGGPAGAALVPDLAKRVPVARDAGRTYTFELREGVRYSNGAPVRASDFKHAIERGFAVVGNPTPALYGSIQGADRCRERPRTCDLSAGIQVDDARGALTIRLAEPDPDFVAKLALPFAFLVPSNAPVKLTPPVKLPGTGPYRVVRYVPGRRVVLERNPHFRVWSHEASPDGFPDRIVVQRASSARRAYQAVRRGLSHIVGVGDSDGLQRIDPLLAGNPERFHTNALAATEFVFLNTRRPPFDDIRARQALSYAIDRERVVALAGGTPAAGVTCQILPPSFPGYRPYCPYTRDPSPAGAWSSPDLAKARRLAEQTGLRGRRVRLYTATDRTPWAREILAALRELGARASLVEMELPRFFEFVNESPDRVQASLVAWIADYVAPSTFVHSLFSCESAEAGGFNYAQFCDEGVERTMQRAFDAQLEDPTRANSIWTAADRRITDLAASVPLFTPLEQDVVSERTGNYEHHPQWGVMYDQLWVR